MKRITSLGRVIIGTQDVMDFGHVKIGLITSIVHLRFVLDPAMPYLSE